MARLVAMCALLVLLASCASGSAESASPDASGATEQATPEQPVESNAAPQTDAPAADTPADEQPEDTVEFISPIGEALGVAQDELALAQAAYFTEAEELVQACMAQAGFEYLPALNGLDESTKAENELRGSLSTQAFTEQYGYGIATLFELDFQGNGVLNFVNDQFGQAPTEPRSAGEQAAYEMALIGRSTQGLSTEEAQELLFGNLNPAANGSCRESGYSSAQNPGALYDGLFSLLGDEMDSLTDRFESDQRVRDELAEWQTCMAQRGHSYERKFEIQQELFDRAGDLANQYLSSPTVLTALGQAQQEGFTLMSGDERYDFLDRVGALQGFSWVPAVQEQVDALIDFELTVANDSLGCSNIDVLEAVQFELETDFVQAHSAQLALIASGEG